MLGSVTQLVAPNIGVSKAVEFGSSVFGLFANFAELVFLLAFSPSAHPNSVTTKQNSSSSVINFKSDSALWSQEC